MRKWIEERAVALALATTLGLGVLGWLTLVVG